VSVVLFIWHPGLVLVIFGVVGVLDVKVHRANVFLVSSVFDIFHVRVSDRNSILRNDTFYLTLDVLSLLDVKMVTVLQDFLLGHLSGFVVDLGKLLHVQKMLIDQVLLVLSKVSQVLGRAASIDLTALNNCAFLYDGSSSNDSIGLDGDPGFEPGVDAYIRERLQSALIELAASAHVSGVPNHYRLAVRTLHMHVVLYDGILSYADGSLVAT